MQCLCQCKSDAHSNAYQLVFYYQQFAIANTSFDTLTLLKQLLELKSTNQEEDGHSGGKLTHNGIPYVDVMYSRLTSSENSTQQPKFSGNLPSWHFWAQTVAEISEMELELVCSALLGHKQWARFNVSLLFVQKSLKSVYLKVELLQFFNWKDPIKAS